MHSFLSGLFVNIRTTHKMCAHLNYFCLVMLKSRFIVLYVRAERLYLFLYFFHFDLDILNIEKDLLFLQVMIVLFSIDYDYIL